MNTTLAAIAGLILFTFVSSAKAAGNFSSEFQNDAAKILNKIKNDGHPQLGDLNLDQFIKVEMPKIRIIPTSENDIIRENKNGRGTAHWENRKGQTTIKVFPEMYKELDNVRDFPGVDAYAGSPQYRTCFALHEYLWSQGYADENYKISHTLCYLAQPEAQKLLAPNERQAFFQFLDGIMVKGASTKARGGGAVVGVGGGGEVGTTVMSVDEMIKATRELPKCKGNKKCRLNIFDQIAYRIRTPLNYESNKAGIYQVIGEDALK